MDTMDTNALPQETLVFHPELDEAIKKLDRREVRTIRNVGYGATVGGMAVTTNYLGRVTEAVINRLSGSRPRSNSYDFKFERLMRQLDPAVVALALLQSGLHSAGSGGKCTHLAAANRIATALNDELWACKFLQTDKKLARKITKAVKDRYGSVELRKKAAKRLAANTGNGDFVMQEWSNVEMAHAGQWGLNLLLESMPEVFLLTAPDHFKAERMWVLTDHGLDMAKAATREAVCKSPVYQPRTERPKDWTTFIMRVAEDDRTLDRAQLLRTFHEDIKSAARQGIRNGTMAPALKGINFLQSVPFKINTWIMDIIIDCYNRGIHVDGMPYLENHVIPEKLPDAVYAAMPDDQRRLHSKTIIGLTKANRTNNSETVQFVEDMETAARTATADCFYTPMSMDWRSRVYGLTRFNFQREDKVRALFLFANGKPIGEAGIWWLKCHVANCAAFKGEDGVGIDKKTFEARVQWVDDNIADITAYVENPLQRTEWMKADAPFLFLAACRELISAIQQGPSYVTHMPTSWDGACNGLQHLAAIMLAPEGSLVNLTDNAEPLDVYRVVAEIAEKLIEADLNSEELWGEADDDKPTRKTVVPVKKLARMALDYGVDRKLVKRNVMTTPYSSNERGMTIQHYDDTMAPLELKLLKKEIKKHPFGDNKVEWHIVSHYLAKRIREAIKQVVGLPMEAMDFMQSLAKALAHEGKPLRWVTPAGVTCINRYHESTTERVELFCYDKGVKVRTSMTVAVGYEKPILKHKAAGGIAPNVVHSLDASHLLLSAGAAADEGIDLATVHDSFGCLACDAPRLNEILREQFLKMYTDHDILAELLESAKRDLDNPDKLPELPAKGSLNLKEILNARYAFA